MNTIVWQSCMSALIHASVVFTNLRWIGLILLSALQQYLPLHKSKMDRFNIVVSSPTVPSLEIFKLLCFLFPCNMFQLDTSKHI